MSSDKIDLILEKLERIEKKVDSIIDDSTGERLEAEESLEEISQLDNRKKLEEVKEQFRVEIEKEQAKKEEKERKRIKEFLENKEQTSVVSNDKLPEIWANLLEIFKSEISAPSFQTWFLPLEPVGFIEDKLVVKTQNEFTRDWLEDRYLELLEKAIYELTDEEIEFEFVTVDSKVIKDLI